MTEKEFIKHLHKERSDFGNPRLAASMANLLDIVSKDIYSESQRFVFELIQNADDASGSSNNCVHFEFLPDSVIVSHNGAPFSKEDIESLTSSGDSTKRSDSTKTGYKGIGFKSVFGRSTRVSIFSGPFQFRFDKKFHTGKTPWQTIPIWTELTDISTQARESITHSKYKVSTIIELTDPDALIPELTSLLDKGQILLFLRRITAITVSKNGQPLHKVTKEITKSTSAFNEVKLSTNSSQHDFWIMKSFGGITIPQQTRTLLEEDEGTPEKLKEATQTEISFAARLHEGRLSPLPRAESMVYTYLPTKVIDYAFPFLVNGSFLTNAPRENLHEDSVWNKWLFTQIADKISDWLVLLAAEKTYTYQVLHLLPEVFNSGQPLKKAFNESFTAGIKTKAFIPVKNNQLKTPSEVIVDKTELSQTSFVSPDSITEFIKTKTGKNFVSDCFVHTQLEVSKKLKTLQVEIFDLENFSDFFTSPAFVKRHDTSKNFLLIQYCKEQSDKDSQGIWFQTLKTLPFIYDEAGRLCNPSNGICFPIGLSSTELGKVPLIHPVVFEEIEKNRTVFEWLEKLGVKEPSEIAFVTNVLIPGIKTGNFINDDNYLRVTRHLFRLFNNKELDEEMLECLRELPLKTRSGSFVAAQECFLSNKYKPELNIENMSLGVELVSEDYVTSGTDALEWNLFFRAIKVKHRVEVEIINANNNLPTLRGLLDPAWVDTSRTRTEAQGGFGYGEHNIIMQTRVPTFLNRIATNIEYCRLFWNNILSSTTIFAELTPTASYRYGVGNGHNGYARNVENYFPWFVRNKPCIPTTTGEIKMATEVFTSQKDIRQIAGDYLPVFDVEINLSQDWQGFLDLKPRLELEDLFEILEKIALETTPDGKIKSGNLQRLGMIYNKLSELVSNMATPDQEKVKAWAADNKLLSTRETFEPARELKWVQIEGFDASSDNLKIIRLPSNAQKKSQAFIDLMNLFGVKIINEFKPDFKGRTIDYELKDRLASILPYYCVIIEYKKYERAAEHFVRLYDILNPIGFYTADKINLSFDHMGELVEGPELRVYKDAVSINYKGRWKSPLNMFDLVPALAEVMDIQGLNDELRLLLESEPIDIIEFMQSKNYDISKLPAKRSFTRIRQLTTETTTVFADEQPDTVDAPSSLSSPSTSSTPVFTSIPFSPDLSPADIDISKVSFTNRKYDASTQPATIVTMDTYADMESQQDRQNVGRWCEEFVNKFLEDNADTYTEILWENKDVESYKPYDFVVKEDGVVRFIDVKGTPSSDKDIVSLSGPEWLFMLQKKELYSIMRVYDAGKVNARIEEIYNPAEKILKGLIVPWETKLQL